MSDPGYGQQQGGPYPPGGSGPYQPDPAWGGQPQPPQQPDPWNTPASGPPGQQYSAPTSGAEYGVPPMTSDYPPAGYPAQASGPGYGAQPASGPPHQPTQSLPIGPPASGPPGPMSGVPAGAPPKSGRGPIVPILAAATGLLLILSIVMTGLFVAKSGQQSDTKDELTASESTVRERDGKIKDLETTNKSQKSELDATKQQLEGTKTKLNTTSDEKAVIGECLRLVFDYISAVADKNTTRANQLIKQLDSPCRRAQVLIR